MRVVCDKCEAIYKIADHKLVKEINRATCKRCGHKIVIFRHNPASARSTLKGNVSPVADGGEAAAPSAHDIEKLAQMTNGGLPSLGSLTAELHAISAPSSASGGSSAAILGPAAQAGADVAVAPSDAARTLPVGSSIPGLNQPPSRTPPSSAPMSSPTPAPASGNGSASAAVMTPIPAKDNPQTQVYRGPAPSGPVLSAAAAQSAAGPAAIPAMPLEGPKRPMPYSQPSQPSLPVAPPTQPSPMGRGYTSPSGEAAPSNTSVTQVEHQGSPLLGTSGVLGAVAFLGLLLIILVPGRLAALGYFLAGFGAAGTMALALVTEKGRWPAKLPSAMVLGVVMGLGCAGLSFALYSPSDGSDAASSDEGLQAETSARPAVQVASVAGGSGAVATPTPSTVATPPAEEVETPARGAASESSRKEQSESSAKREAERRSSRRSERETRREAREPVMPGLSASDLEDLEETASASRLDDKVPERRGSHSGREASSRRRDYQPSDEIAGSDSNGSYQRRSASGRSEQPVASRSADRSSSTPRTSQPKRAKKDSGSKSSGGAPNPFIIKTIIGSNKSIKRCITSQKTRDPDLSGKIYVKFKIAPSGQVSRARVTTSRYAGTALDTCISREVNALRFPPFEGKTQNITYPLLVIAD